MTCEDGQFRMANKTRGCFILHFYLQINFIIKPSVPLGKVNNMWDFRWIPIIFRSPPRTAIYDILNQTVPFLADSDEICWKWDCWIYRGRGRSKNYLNHNVTMRGFKSERFDCALLTESSRGCAQSEAELQRKNHVAICCCTVSFRGHFCVIVKCPLSFWTGEYNKLYGTDDTNRSAHTNKRMDRQELTSTIVMISGLSWSYSFDNCTDRRSVLYSRNFLLKKLLPVWGCQRSTSTCCLKSHITGLKLTVFTFKTNLKAFCK